MEDKSIEIWIVPAISGLFALLVAADLVNDYQSGSTWGHLSLEGILLVLSGTVFVWGIKQLTQAKRVIHTLRTDLETVAHEKETWKEENRKLLEGLSAKIEQQFAHWKLTEAETEVGFLLLKGLTLKEIAGIRNTKLKTVQQQSQAIYQKTGLASRSELAAFFLEDLLPPANPEARTHDNSVDKYDPSMK